MRTIDGWIAVAALSTLVGCSSDVTPIEDCETAFGIEPICAFHNPEDLALLPDGRSVVVSQAAHEGAANGSLVRYDTVTGDVETLFPTPLFVDRRDWRGRGGDRTGPT